MEKPSLKKGIENFPALLILNLMQNVIFFKQTSIHANSTLCHFRYNEDLELEDAIHTAILTLKVKLHFF